MNKYGIEVGDRFLLPFRYVNAINCCPTENNDYACTDFEYKEIKVEL